MPRSRLNLGQGHCCLQAGLLSWQKELIITSLSCRLRMPVRTGEYGQLIQARPMLLQGQVTANLGKPLFQLLPCAVTLNHRPVICKQLPVSRISCLESLCGGSSLHCLICRGFSEVCMNKLYFCLQSLMNLFTAYIPPAR